MPLITEDEVRKVGKAANTAAPRLEQLRGVDLFTIGTHHGKTYTAADLDEMVEAFNRFQRGPRALMRVPAVLGHGEDQKFLEQEGLPAAAWLDSVYRQGDTLKGNFRDVPPKIAALIRAHAYREVSAEIYDEPPDGIPGSGKLLRRIAFLGADVPEVKGMQPLPDPEPQDVSKHAERQRQRLGRDLTRAYQICFSRIVAQPSAGTFIAFSEVRPMDREQMLKKLVEEGKYDPERVKDAPDHLLAEMCDKMDEHKSESKGDGDEPDDEEFDEEAVAKMPEEERKAKAEEYSSRAKKYADYAAKFGGSDEIRGKNQAQQVRAMWHKDPEGEGHPDHPDNHAEPDAGIDMTTGTPKKTTVTHQFAERMDRLERNFKGAISRIEKTLGSKVASLDKFAEDRIAAETRARIDGELKALVHAGRVLPAQLDAGHFEYLYDLPAAGVVVKFSEGGKAKSGSPLDKALVKLRSGPILQRYGEQVKGGATGSNDGEEEVAKVLRFAESNTHALSAAGKEPADFVASFQEARKKNPKLTAKQYGVSEQAA